MSDDYFGSCPECGKTDGYVNVGRSHWFYCHEHRKRWCVGFNLFSSWRDETEEQQRERFEPIADYSDTNESAGNAAAKEIVFKLVPTFFLTRWRCTVCGSHTEKDPILCESDDGERICDQCLKAGDLDARLEDHATRLEARARHVRGMIGRLKAPTYEDWQKACLRHDEEQMRLRGVDPDEVLRSGFGRSSPIESRPADDDIPF